MKRCILLIVVLSFSLSCSNDESRLIGEWWLAEEGRVGGEKPLVFEYRQASPVLLKIMPDKSFEVTMNVLTTVPAYSGVMKGVWRLDLTQNLLETVITEGTLVILDKSLEINNSKTNLREFIYTTNASAIFGITNWERVEFLNENTLILYSQKKPLYDQYKRE